MVKRDKAEKQIEKLADGSASFMHAGQTDFLYIKRDPETHQTLDGVVRGHLCVFHIHFSYPLRTVRTVWTESAHPPVLFIISRNRIRLYIPLRIPLHIRISAHL